MKINELVAAKQIMQYIQFHDELNPALWEGEKLKPEVREKLLEISNEFYEFLEVEGLVVSDIMFTGSNAAFNYNTKNSDIDLHLLVDMTQVCEELAENFFNTKKTLWNKIHNIQIEGLDVELYVEDFSNQVHAAGIYSVMNDDWIKRPVAEKPAINDTSLVAKTEQYVDLIETLLAGEPSKQEVKEVLIQIYELRKAGLDSPASEWSVENLAFKSLRNLGYLDKIRNYILKAGDKELSLSEAISAYGRYCPKCGNPTIRTERRMSPDALDRCSSGHEYKRSDATRRN